MSKRLFLATTLAISLGNAALTGVIDDPFSDPEATSSPIGCVQAHLHKVGYNAGPIDGLFGRSTKRAADQLRDTLVPFHENDPKGGIVSVPEFTQATAEEWCRWLEARNPNGMAGHILYQVRETRTASYLAAITLGQAAEIRMITTAEGDIDRTRPYFFQGDHDPDQIQSADGILRNYLRLNAMDYHVMTRPFGYSEEVRRQATEWQFHAAVLSILGEAYGISEFRVSGHSGGGHLAISLGQNMDGVSCAVAGAAILAVKEQYRNVDKRVPQYVRTQYDPADHALSNGVKFGVIYNPGDPILSNFGVLPFVENQEKRHQVVRLSTLRDTAAEDLVDAELVYLETSGAPRAGAHIEPMLLIPHMIDRICPIVP